MLCELETDKVSVEVPSPVAGVLAEILAPEGSTVAANARLAIVTEGAAAAKSEAKADAKPETKAAKAEEVNSPGAGPETVKPAKDVEDAPAAKKAMAEAGLSRDQVQATGRDGRVMKEDVARTVAGASVPPPLPPPRPRPPPPSRARPSPPTTPPAKSGSR